MLKGIPLYDPHNQVSIQSAHNLPLKINCQSFQIKPARQQPTVSKCIQPHFTAYSLKLSLSLIWRSATELGIAHLFAKSRTLTALFAI